MGGEGAANDEENKQGSVKMEAGDDGNGAPMMMDN